MRSYTGRSYRRRMAARWGRDRRSPSICNCHLAFFNLLFLNLFRFYLDLVYVISATLKSLCSPDASLLKITSLTYLVAETK